MADPSLIMYEEEFRQIDAELHKLYAQTNAVMTLLVDKNGQLIASVGQPTDNMDITSLASLTASRTLAELPLVEMATATSPFLPKARNCRENT